MGGLFGGGGSSPPKVSVDLEKILRESARMRQSFLPFLMEQFGFQATRHPGSSGSANDQWDVTRLPLSPQQQAIERLGLTSLGGAQNAAEMMNQRLQMAQGLLPGLMGSVRASMAPGLRPSWVPRTGSPAGMSPLPSAASPTVPSITSAPPASSITPASPTPAAPSPAASSPDLARLLEQVLARLNTPPRTDTYGG